MNQVHKGASAKPFLSAFAWRFWRTLQFTVWLIGAAHLLALIFWPKVGLSAFWNVLIPVAPALIAIAPQDLAPHLLAISLATIAGPVGLIAGLVRLVRDVPCKFNLIPFNPFPQTHYRRSNAETIQRFRDVLMQADIVATMRKTRGDDIAAACGQLAGRVQDKTRRTMHQMALH